MRKIIFFLLVSISFINVSTAQNKSKIKTESDQIINWFKTGEFAKVSNQVEMNYRSYFTPSVFEKDWAELTGTYGKYQSHRYVSLETAPQEWVINRQRRAWRRPTLWRQGLPPLLRMYPVLRLAV